ncbi:glycosyltransferase 61 family protein [Azospirillum sp.]|uniref:glycosyltransferase 61 family protein n=1 Tax=Azospirillum sp. TaxID=34012 RepID=UPI003D755E53
MTDSATGKTFTLALALHQAGWLDKAADSYANVLREDPRHADAHYLLGLVRYEQGLPAEAAQHLRAALAVDPAQARAHVAAANAASAQFDVVVAGAHFRAALALEPADAETLRQFAGLMRWDRKLAEAAALFRRALAARPGDPGLMHQLSGALMEGGEVAEAERWLRASLAADGGNPVTLAALGAMMTTRGRPAEALPAYEAALAAGGDALDLHLGLAAALEALGRRDEAAAQLSVAAADAWPADDLLRFTRRLFDLGDADAAEAVYRRFAALTDDRRRFPNAALRRLTVRPAAEVCREQGWTYHQVEAPRLCHAATADGERSFAVPEVFLARIDGAEVVPSSCTVVAGESLLLDGLSTNSRLSVALLPHVVAHAADERMLLDLPAAAETVEEEAILLGGGPNWSHGVLDWSSKLAVLERFPELAGLPVLVAPTLPGSIRDLFELLGVPRARMRPLPAGEPLRARRLWVPSLTHSYQFTSPTHTGFLRRRLAPLIAEGMARPRRRIFLSRRQAGYRALVNEAEVLAALAPLGVEPVVPEDFPMAEQIALFASAELIVGPIGGGSAAIAFAPPGAAYVELVHRRIALPQYGILTALLGQRYRQIVGPMRGNRGPSEFDYDFAVDPAAVAAAARGLLDG